MNKAITDIQETVEKVEEVTKVDPTTVEKMDRLEESKKCCKVSESTRCACHCCLRTWSFTLNGCEGCCAALSTCCLFASSVAMGINKCLEQMDCDGH
jgi:hypothetical protein